MEQEELKIGEIQHISLEILKKITSICESQNFRYTLAYGTLIGAIRHKGFIPWDDDIDIQMPRPDYESFIKYMHEHPVDNLRLYNHKYDKNYPLGISRIADDRYKIVGDIASEHCDMGIFVDIYPIDGLGNTYEEAKTAYQRTDKLRANLLRLINKNQFSISLRNLLKHPRFTISSIKLKILGLSYIQRALEHTSTMYEFSQYEYVGIPNWNWIKLVYKREWFEEFIECPFENGLFYISRYYDNILRAEYGDYMQLPPVEKQIYHHGYKAYRK